LLCTGLTFSTLSFTMSEILLTPRPEPISPVDPDMKMPRRAPSQSTEFFNSLYVEGVRGHTRPLQVIKKPATLTGKLSFIIVECPKLRFSVFPNFHCLSPFIADLYSLVREPHSSQDPTTSSPIHLRHVHGSQPPAKQLCFWTIRTSSSPRTRQSSQPRSIPTTYPSFNKTT
jgi:hypothetical protein